MNHELLQKVRELKIQKKSDEEIKGLLKEGYSEDELAKALASLQYMVAPGEVASIGEPMAEKQPKWYNVPKHWRPVVVLVAIIGFFTAYSFAMEMKQYHAVNSITDRLETIYSVDKSYDLGSTKVCKYLQPTRFGEFFGDSVCYLYVAKLFYPRVDVGTVRGGGDATHAVDLPYIQYVDAKGDSLRDYIEFGVPIRQLGDEPQTPRERLGIKGPIYLDFSGVSGPTQGDDKIGGKWRWETASVWPTNERDSSAAFQKNITKTIVADKAPTKGAVTASEALKQGKAPVVAVFSARYCHSIKFAFVDQLCILPD